MFARNVFQHLRIQAWMFHKLFKCPTAHSCALHNLFPAENITGPVSDRPTNPHRSLLAA